MESFVVFVSDRSVFYFVVTGPRGRKLGKKIDIREITENVHIQLNNLPIIFFEHYIYLNLLEIIIWLKLK